jgi:hypothetical protein
MASTSDGMEMAVRELQLKNAPFSISRRSECTANVTVARHVQEAKQASPIRRTDAGIHILFSDVHLENADPRISRSAESDAKQTVSREWQAAKQCSAII